MQSIVSNALKIERARVLNRLSICLHKNIRVELDQLLENEDFFYQLTLLKKDPKDFSTTEMRKEVEKQQRLIGIYEKSKNILEQLKLSPKNIEYYAEMASFYPVIKLKRFQRNLARLYLLCYVHQRLLKVNNHLATFFSYRVNNYYGNAEQYAKDQEVLENEKTRHQILKASRLISLYSDKRIPDNHLRPSAFQIIPEEEIDQFVKDLVANEAKKTAHIWKYLEKENRAINVNLRPVFQSINFICEANTPMKEAIEFLNNRITNKLTEKHISIEDAPQQFIPNKLLSVVIDKVVDPQNKRRKIKMINAARYEYMVYSQLQKMLDSGQVYISESISYRRLEDELIPIDIWIRDKNKILDELNLPVLNYPITEMLTLLNQALTNRYKEINKHIETGENTHIKIDENKNSGTITWRLPYKKQDDVVNNPFYENLPNTNIGDLVSYVINTTQINKHFTHIQQRFTKNKIDFNNMIAVLIANATGIGARKMAEISDMNINELITTEKNYFRLNTLRKANDEMVNHIAKLPVFKFYTLSDYGIHASVDGQKVETRYNTIKARYSKKYYGLGQGVVSYKLVGNHLPINDKIIGANEYEGHYLFDIVYNNTSDLEIYAVSGDMHSINRINFALMHLFGYRFMPRFTQFSKKAQDSLVYFQDPKKLEKDLIKPKNKVNESLIIKEWDNILRILASLAMKETTQAVVIKKLASYRRTNPTLKALIEFDGIIMSLYMLDYIDDPEMRSNVHRSLNRGEALHQLIAAIRKVSDKKLPGKTEMEMNMYNECNRLIANCIICYNAIILSSLYDAYEKHGNKRMCELIKRLSPVAWQHINFVGKYEFRSDKNMINLQALTDFVLAHSKINIGLESQVE